MDNKETGVTKALPTLAELTVDIEQAYKDDAFNALLNNQPPSKWVAEHPYIKTEVKDANGNKSKVPYRYLPIDKAEYLLRKIFKQFKIEITGQGTAFNGVWVTVRVHYLNPVTNEWSFHDGTGASQLQTKSGASPADMININNGAISMAFPLAKTLAVKDACDHFGDLFGANLNRRDTLQFTPDANLDPAKIIEIPVELEAAIAEADSDNLASIYRANTEYHTNPKFMQMLNKRRTQLSNAHEAQ
jgi:hypothetical protein